MRFRPFNRIGFDLISDRVAIMGFCRHNSYETQETEASNRQVGGVNRTHARVAHSSLKTHIRTRSSQGWSRLTHTVSAVRVRPCLPLPYYLQSWASQTVYRGKLATGLVNIAFYTVLQWR